MTMKSNGLRATMFLIVAVIGPASPVLAATGKADSWDPFRLLAERNIFLRDRRRPEPRRSEGPRPVLDDGERRVVLTGTALCGAEFVAFFENTRTGDTIRARAGGAVGAGKLNAVTLDGVEYEADGKTTRIEIGFSLAGEPGSLPSRRTSATATSESASPPAESEAKPETETGATDGQVTPKQEATAPPDGTPDATPKASTSPGGAGDADVADILQRMRQRREEESKK